MSHISDIHHMMNPVSRQFQGSVKQIFKNICSQISDVCEIVNSGTAAVEPCFSGFKGHKIDYPALYRIVQFQGRGTLPGVDKYK